MTDTRITQCTDLEDLEKDPELFMNEDGEMVELAEWSPAKLQKLWDTAIENFPHDLDPTSYEDGTPPEDLEADEFGNLEEDLEYSVEYEFEAGTLADHSLMAGGWIEMRMDVDDDEPHIYGWFDVSFDGKWHDAKSRVLGKNEALQTWFDNDSETWDDLVIESM